MPNSFIEIDFADGSYTFALPLGRIQELERKCGLPGPPVGIGKIFARVLAGIEYRWNEATQEYDLVLVPGRAEFHAIDLVETIRQGLIGGGVGVVNEQEVKVTAALAERLIQSYVLDRPLSDHWSMAASILGACVKGYDPPKKD
jgi:hypothetical protein